MNHGHEHGHGGDGGHGEGGHGEGGHGEGGHGEHGDQKTDDDSCMMTMSFHAGHCELILWKEWTAKTEVQFVFSALAIFVIAFIYEGLKYVRERLYLKAAKGERARLLMHQQAGSSNGICCSSAPIIERTLVEKLFNSDHVIQTILQFLQMSISYLLMLIVMTYNYWLFAAIILGGAAGYFCFGWIRQQAVDSSEHCH